MASRKGSRETMLSNLQRIGAVAVVPNAMVITERHPKGVFWLVNLSPKPVEWYAFTLYPFTVSPPRGSLYPGEVVQAKLSARWEEASLMVCPPELLRLLAKKLGFVPPRARQLLMGTVWIYTEPPLKPSVLVVLAVK